MKSFRLVGASVELLGTRVKEVIPTLRFTPATSGGQKIRQRIQQWFVFRLDVNPPRPAFAAASDFFEKYPEARGNQYNVFITATRP